MSRLHIIFTSVLIMALFCLGIRYKPLLTQPTSFIVQAVYIQKALNTDLNEICINFFQPFAVYDSIDINNDGQKELIVSLHESQSLIKKLIVLSTDQDPKLQKISFLRKDGSIGDVLFLEGVYETSGMHTVFSKIDKTIHSTHWFQDAFDTRVHNCETDTYTWNDDLNIFVYRSDLSQNLAQPCVDQENQ